MSFCALDRSFIALSAFLRGIERRAFVLAQAQCGNTAMARIALAATTAQFTATASAHPLSAWPRHFWSLLLAQPELLTHAPLQGPLKMLTPGPRAVLLLRLVADVDIAGVAQILKVRESASRIALSRALSQLHANGVSAHELQQMQSALQASVRANHAKQEGVSLPEPMPPLFSTSRITAKKMNWLGAAWVLLALLLLALAATFIWPLPSRLKSNEVRELPPLLTQSPAYDDATLVMHPDYALLSAPDEQKLAHELPLLSWLAAGSPNERSPNTASHLQEVTTSQADVEATP